MFPLRFEHQGLEGKNPILLTLIVTRYRQITITVT